MMKIICRARGGGKTTQIIEEARKLNGYNLIVCKDMREAGRVWKIILDNKYDLPMPISFNEFIHGNFSTTNVNAFLIDNVDLLIQTLARGLHIHAVTFTEDVVNGRVGRYMCQACGKVYGDGYGSIIAGGMCKTCLDNRPDEKLRQCPECKGHFITLEPGSHVCNKQIDRLKDIRREP